MSGISVVKGTRIKHSQKTGVVKRSSIMPAMLAAMGTPIGHTYEYTMRNIILQVEGRLNGTNYDSLIYKQNRSCVASPRVKKERTM